MNDTRQASEQAIRDVVGAVVVPYTGQTLAEAGAIDQLECNEGVARISLRLGFPAAGYRDSLGSLIAAEVQALPGIDRCETNIDWRIVTHAVQRNLKPLAGVKNIIAVASAKGGVGKSTTAVNLALGLAREGAAVGLLDADIYGPSQPIMLGLQGQSPASSDGQSLEPLRAHGLQAMSIGFLIDPDQPMVWRGPMVTQALNQLLTQTRWSDLDYLIIDLPPGTGDIQLTLAQGVPVSGAVIVTTPQDIALADAIRGLKMFEKVAVPVLGVVENMSTHVCSHCGHEEAIFGQDGGRLMAEQNGVPLLGSLPLDIAIRSQTDSGRPTVIADPEGAISLAYREIARHTAGRLSRTSKDYSRLFPKITVEDN